jgi:hypothetical protein
MHIFKTTQRIWMQFILIDSLIQEVGLHVYDMHNIVEYIMHVNFSISIATAVSSTL